MSELGNQRSEEQRNKALKTAQGQVDEAMRWLLGDAKGRAVIWAQLERAGVFRGSMAATPELTAFNEGKRDMGLGLLAAVMRLAPEQYLRMASEAKARANPPKKSTDSKDEESTDG